MKRLRLAAWVTAILGFLSILSLLYLFCSIFNLVDLFASPDVDLYIDGACLLVLSVFTVSVYVMLGYLLNTSDRLINLTTDTGINK
ncbi:MAG TPA: hypothetical protein VHO50_11075 [Bacteroidales bacterium]|nr:hypothetical protein [Bacteroidales bacterium]